MKYLVKVIEKHVGTVWVEAESPREARDRAVGMAECQYDCTYDCEVIDEEPSAPED